MTCLSFFTDASVTGHVRGLGLGSSPAQWEQALGDDYIDDVRKGRMRRDYGLVELSFLRAAGSWDCVEISIQAHRLSLPSEDLIPESLIRTYGAFSDRIAFSDLRKSILEVGASVEAIQDATRSRYSRFWIPDSRALIHVTGERLSEPGIPTSGDVWSIALSRDTEIWKAPLK